MVTPHTPPASQGALSEDGILVIQLEQRRLLIAVQQLDDLERIYNTLVDAR